MIGFLGKQSYTYDTQIILITISKQNIFLHPLCLV